jgi:hypothetical protein
MFNKRKWSYHTTMTIDGLMMDGKLCLTREMCVR